MSTLSLLSVVFFLGGGRPLPFHILFNFLLKFLCPTVIRCTVVETKVVFMLRNEHTLPSTRTLAQGFELT